MLRDEKSLWAKKEEVSVEEAIRRLKTPLNPVQRYGLPPPPPSPYDPAPFRQLLKFFVPIARTGVIYREHSKVCTTPLSPRPAPS